MDLWNVSTLPQLYTVWQPRRTRLETPRPRSLKTHIEKLIVAQVANKFHSLFEIWRWNVLTVAHNWILNSVLSPTPFYFKIRFNIILVSTLWSTKWCLTIRSFDQHFVCISHLPVYATSASLYILVGFITLITLSVEWKRCSSSLCYSLLRPVTSYESLYLRRWVFLCLYLVKGCGSLLQTGYGCAVQPRESFKNVNHVNIARFRGQSVFPLFPMAFEGREISFKMLL
jgi:hypothetical protein